MNTGLHHCRQWTQNARRLSNWNSSSPSTRLEAGSDFPLYSVEERLSSKPQLDHGRCGSISPPHTMKILPFFLQVNNDQLWYQNVTLCPILTKYGDLPDMFPKSWNNCSRNFGAVESTIPSHADKAHCLCNNLLLLHKLWQL